MNTGFQPHIANILKIQLHFLSICEINGVVVLPLFRTEAISRQKPDQVAEGLTIHCPAAPSLIPESQRVIVGIFYVRPARAHSCGCKSHRKLITTNEVKRNCMRVTECGEEAWSIAVRPAEQDKRTLSRAPRGPGRRCFNRIRARGAAFFLAMHCQCSPSLLIVFSCAACRSAGNGHLD